MSGRAAVRLTAEQLRTVEAAAKEAYPEEACGLLVGRPGENGRCRVNLVEASANVAEPPRTRRFEVDPMLRLRLERALRESPDSIVGVYHSHPGGAAAPSDTDLAMVFEPALVWLITAVGEDGAAETMAWRPNAEATAFVPVDIELEPAEAA